MDLDAFAAVRESRWQRLHELQRRRSLTGAEADEFANLFQMTATDLSEVRSAAPDPVMISRLSTLLAASRSSLAGAREPLWREVARFFAVQLPASLYRLRWWTAGVTAVFLLISVSSAVYLSTTPGAMDGVGDFDARQQYAEQQFAQYYVEYPSTSFFAQVWTNNARVALMSVAFGMTGVVPAWVQYGNAASVGSVAAIMYEFDGLDVFFQLLLPHGLLELTAVWVAGAAGFKVFWTMFVPGRKPRLRALADEGRALGGVALGLVVVLMISGVIEGYVTGSSLPWLAKDAIGVAALAGFWTLVFVLGRRAERAGEIGDVSRDYREDFTPTAA